VRSCSSRALKRSGVLTQDPVFVDEHLDAVIVHRDPRLLSVLREQCLAPLDTVAAASRQMLLDTLRSWLRNMGDLSSPPTSCTSTGRRCATGWGGCASCSAGS